MAAEDTSYNGWSNYPTWALSNDRALYEQMSEMARSALKEANEPNELVDRAGMTTHQLAASYLADEFSEWVSEDLSPDLGPSFAGDLYGWALGQVEWLEIAQQWIATALEESSAEVDTGSVSAGDC